MAKNYQDMSMEELFKEKVQIESKIDNLKEQISKYEGDNILIQYKIEGLEADIKYLRTAILNIKTKVSTYKPISIQEKISFKEEWKENFEKKLASILEKMDSVLGSPHKVNGFTVLIAGEIDKKTKNRPLHFTHLYDEIFEDFIDKEERLAEQRHAKRDNNAQLEGLQKELQFLELEYYAIKLTILRKEQSLENAIVSKKSLENNAELIVNMFDTDVQTEEEGIILARDLTSIPMNRDGGED